MKNLNSLKWQEQRLFSLTLGRKLQRVVSAKRSVDLRSSFISDYILYVVPHISPFSFGLFRKVISVEDLSSRFFRYNVAAFLIRDSDPSFSRFVNGFPGNSIVTVMQFAWRNNLIPVSIVDNIT